MNSLKVTEYPKKQEKFPSDLIGKYPALVQAYHETDLTWLYVKLRCETLIRLKMIPETALPKELIETWFRMFLKEHWTKEIFDNRFEQVIRTPLYGDRIDTAYWFMEGKAYYEWEIKKRTDEAITEALAEGERLISMIGKIELTEEQKKLCKLTAMKQLRTDYAKERSIKFNEFVEEEKERIREILRRKRQALKKLTKPEIDRIVSECSDLLTENKVDLNIFRKYPDTCADIIPSSFLRLEE